MIFAGVFFVFLSVVFSSPQVFKLLAGEAELSHKEKWISILFGNYLKADAFLVFLLWGLKPYSIPYVYQAAGILYLLIIFLFLKKMVMILK